MLSNYFLKLDEEGYIIDVSKYGNAIPGYAEKTIDDTAIPVKVMRGYYKWEDDSFVVDPVKEAEVDAVYDALPE